MTQIAFLGICDSLTRTPNIAMPFTTWNILALRHEVICPFFPVALGEKQNLVFAVLTPPIAGVIKFESRNDPERYHFSCTISVNKIDNMAFHAVKKSDIKQTELPRWDLLPIEIPAQWRFIEKPDILDIRFEFEGKVCLIGSLSFLLANIPPLTPEIEAAIRSDPNAAKVAYLGYECRWCKDRVVVYTGLERSTSMENDGCMWLPDAPNEFRCKCGKTAVSLQYVKKGLHWMLGRHRFHSENVGIVRLYETTALKEILARFESLVADEPREEIIHQFINDNPLIFTRFSPKLLLSKSTVIGLRNVDFGILSYTGELFLIEIERPDLLLLKKDGDISAKLTHAIGQVTEWLDEYLLNRSAVLRAMNISENIVTAVRGVVIAGRDGGYKADHLRRLKSSDKGQITFYTYDDMIGSVRSAIEEFRRATG